MEEFGGEGAGECVDGGLLLGGEVSEAFGGAGEFGLANSFCTLLEGEDGGDGVAGDEALLVFGYLVGDDVLGGFGLAATVGEMGGGDLLEVVDVVDEAALDLIHAGVDVAGNGDIDEEHGAAATALEEVLAVGAGEDLLGGAGGGDDDVGAFSLIVEGVEGDDGGGAGGAAELVGDLLGAGLGAVGDEDGGSTLLDEMTGGEIGHLAGTDDEDGLALEATEDLAGQVHGY